MNDKIKQMDIKPITEKVVYTGAAMHNLAEYAHKTALIINEYNAVAVDLPEEPK